MMKNILLLAIVLFFYGCRGTGTNSPEKTYLGNYQVTRIDSIGNYYLIYAFRNDSTFKIVSKKYAVKYCNRILQSNSYFFSLRSSLIDTSIGEGLYSPKGNLSVNCHGYDNDTTICFEDGCVRDLFYADNIKGLCYIDQ